MSVFRDVLTFVFGRPPQTHRPSTRLPVPVPGTPKNGSATAGQHTTRPPQATPHRQPAAPQLTVRQFQEALGLALKLVVVRPSLPILSHCLLGHGTLTVTDLDHYLTLAVAGLDIASVCVPAALLQKALRFVTDPVRLELRGSNVILNNTFTLPGMDPGEFPSPPVRTAQELLGEAFPVPARWADLLPAVSPDETRLTLSGVCIDLAAGYCVSSDGHRLHALTIPPGAEDATGIVGLSAAKMIARLLTRGAVSGQFFVHHPALTTEQQELLAVEITDTTPAAVRQKRATLEQELQRPTHALFRAPGIELWTRLADGEFPDYLSLLQRSPKCTPVTLPRAPFIAALKACLACAPKQALGVSLTRLAAGVRVRLEATENGGVERLIECQGWQPGCYIGLNTRYLLQALECRRTEEVVLQIADPVTPVHITDPDLHVVIMPVRVSEPAECQHDRKGEDLTRETAECHPS